VKWIVMVLSILFGFALFRFWFDAPAWGAMVGGYVFWIMVRPKEWQ